MGDYEHTQYMVAAEHIVGETPAARQVSGSSISSEVVFQAKYDPGFSGTISGDIEHRLKFSRRIILPTAYCGTGADDASVGTVAWTNPTYVQGDNASYAEISLSSETSHYLKATNFGLSIPTGATIKGIEFEISINTGASYLTASTIKGGSIGGIERGGSSILGGSNDLWGETWTPADLNASDFGIAMYISTLTDTFKVSNILVRIYFSHAGTYTWQKSTAAGWETIATATEDFVYSAETVEDTGFFTPGDTDVPFQLQLVYSMSSSSSVTLEASVANDDCLIRTEGSTA